MTKKNNRRMKELYPNLNTKFNLKVRKELIDQDYINKLSTEEKLMA